MKRFLSLVLSALFVFQAGNASCDAGSVWDTRKVPVQQRGLFVSYIPQQQPIINFTAPEQPAPVVNVTTTPSQVKQDLHLNVKATSTGDEIAGWLRTVFYLSIAAIGGVVLYTVWPVLGKVWLAIKGIGMLGRGIDSVWAMFTKLPSSLWKAFSFPV